MKHLFTKVSQIFGGGENQNLQSKGQNTVIPNTNLKT